MVRFGFKSTTDISYSLANLLIDTDMLKKPFRTPELLVIVSKYQR